MPFAELISLPLRGGQSAFSLSVAPTSKRSEEGAPFSESGHGELQASPADGVSALQHEDTPGAKLQGEVLALEEERAQVLGRVEQLKVRVKELEQQLQESAREVSWEGPGVALRPAGGRPSERPASACLDRPRRGPGCLPQAEMERALLQGEREAEWALLQKEQKAVDQLQEKLVALETGIQKERDKVTHSWPGPGLATGGLGEGQCHL